MSALQRPRLRPLEGVMVNDAMGARRLRLRDVEGFAPSAVLLAADLGPIVSRFDGIRSVAQIALEASRSSGTRVDAAFVAQIVRELDGALLLDSESFRARRAAILRDFDASPVRRAHHAGGAYAADPVELASFIERRCLDGHRAAAPRRTGARLVGLSAPHMDLFRAAEGYGAAYAELAFALAAQPNADTFILLGTCHAPIRSPFSLCRKGFATPLGLLEPDADAIAELAARSDFDVHAEEHLHRCEHSLEFQAVFLRHLLGARPATIVPVLCGLGDAAGQGRIPESDGATASFLDALAALVAARGERVIIIAGADLAHVGPRFGDGAALDAPARAALRRRDEDSAARAAKADAPGFFAHVAEDQASRRVCGVGPIYTMLKVLPRGASGELLHYAQCVDPDDGSIVTHASLSFYEGPPSPGPSSG